MEEKNFKIHREQRSCIYHNRRLFCGSGGCLILVLVAVIVYLAVSKYLDSSNGSSTLSSNTTFPTDFKIGVSSAAYQIEGAWNESGKSPNIWDNFTHQHPELIADGTNGDVTCDSYHKYEEDVQMVKEIGFQMYRFSISWSRIIPNGCDNVTNSAGLLYYQNLIDELLANDIQPLVTIYHLDLPQSLLELGGWTNSTTADCYLYFADTLFREYGDKVKWWVTINEIWSLMMGYGTSGAAPGLDGPGTYDYQACHNLLLAHSKAYRLYEAEYKSSQQGKVGITADSDYFAPLNSSSSEDEAAVNRALQFMLGIVSHPIFSTDGDYPPIVKEIVYNNSIAEGRNSSRLPSFTSEEIENIKGSADFFGLNHYNTVLVTSGYTSSEAYFGRDANFISIETLTSSAGFRKLLNWIKTEYDNPPVFVTENGYNTAEVFYDEDRIEYYNSYIEAMLKAINEDGCDVIGYSAWSLMDDFEWIAGYTAKFGLWHVDFNDTDRTRTKKMSAYFFKELLTNRQLPSLPFSL